MKPKRRSGRIPENNRIKEPTAPEKLPVRRQSEQDVQRQAPSNQSKLSQPPNRQKPNTRLSNQQNSYLGKQAFLDRDSPSQEVARSIWVADRKSSRQQSQSKAEVFVDNSIFGNAGNKKPPFRADSNEIRLVGSSLAVSSKLDNPVLGSNPVSANDQFFREDKKYCEMIEKLKGEIKDIHDTTLSDKNFRVKILKFLGSKK